MRLFSFTFYFSMIEAIENLPVPVTAEELSEDLWKEYAGIHNPYLDLPGFKPLKSEKPIHKEAFMIWSGLSSPVRTDRAVADRLNSKGGSVTPAAIGKWRKSFNWEARLAHMEQDSLERRELVKADSFVDQIESVISACNLAIDSFTLKLQEGKVEITVDSYIKLSKWSIQLKEKLAMIDSPQTRDSNDFVSAIKDLIEGSDASVKSIVVNSLKVHLKDGESLPEDELMQLREYKKVQNVIDAEEIGDSGYVDYATVETAEEYKPN